MAFTPYQIILAVGLVFTGFTNTISIKWADNIESAGTDGKVRKFNHPFVQALIMFLGEFMCLLVFKIAFKYHMKRQYSVEDSRIVNGNQKFNPLLFFFPAICDMVASTLMYIGLNFTYASSYQMLRGGVIIFTAILSKMFLRRKVTVRHWMGILLIIVGLCVVGISDLLVSKKSTQVDGSYTTEGIITGDLLIFVAQIITAAQMVYEEKYVVANDIPALQAVGWEGVFGMVAMSLLLIPFYFIKVGEPLASNSRGSLEDFPDAIAQIVNNKILFAALMGNVVSIAFFNFMGISVTKEISATSRMILDSLRTFFIWTFSLAVGWQAFHFLQPIGFGTLLIGMCVYNNMII
ncbi:solute carrier family 35 member F6-like [Adelges cooleyi]|uniref:solute carrier family 35 member F6-like n=1 Tax=Adelges cooleyi TaxID=133065 RepID=UPI00217F38C3|nr:solute carrier family 35 member F6-like [Adelges cooleyi]